MNGTDRHLLDEQSIHWTEYGIPIRNLWHMLLYAWNELSFRRLWSNEDVDNSPTLDALLATILAKLMQQRLRIGLGRNYVDERFSIRGVRGRIDFTKSLKRRTFEHGMTFCKFQHYSANVLKNQIVRSMIARLVQVGNFGPDVARANELRHHLRWLSRGLDSIDLIELKPDIIHRQQLGRNDGDYRLMLDICELLLQRQMPTDDDGIQKISSLDRDSMVFHRIYERFVANFYRIHLKGWAVTPQMRLGWHEKNPNPFMPAMHPDLVLEDKLSGRIIILDTKFTAQSLIDNQWSKQVFSSSNLYQMYAYLRSQEHRSDEYRVSTGILLYPTASQHVSEEIDLQGHRMIIKTVDLTRQWQEIEAFLIALIENA